MSEDTSTPGEVPAAPGSTLEALRNRRKAMKEGLVCTLQVPRLEPPVYVQYVPITRLAIDSINDRLREDDDPDWVVESNATHLAMTCRSIGEVVGGEVKEGKQLGGKFVSLHPDGKPLKFDDRLRDLLDISELEAPNATALVRALFATDGDVISTATKLTKWSGFGADIREAELLGN